MTKYINEMKKQAQRLFQDGDLENACAVYQELSQSTPGDAEVWEKLGAIHGMRGDYAGSIEYSRKSVELMPDGFQSNINLANACNFIGALDDACKYYRNVTRIKPDYAAAWHAIGYIYLQKGKSLEALRELDEALRHEPAVASTNYLKSYCLLNLGRMDECIDYAVRALRYDPANSSYKQYFVSVLELMRFSTIDTATITEIRNCMERHDISHQSLVGAVISALLLDSRFNSLMQLAGSGDYETLKMEILENKWDDVLGNSLLLGLLEKTVVCDYGVERMLVAMRRIFADCVSGEDPAEVSRLSEVSRDFIISLAHQCFNNEYVYPVGDEAAAVEDLVQTLSVRLAGEYQSSDELTALTGVVATYRPLSSVAGSDRLVSGAGAGHSGVLDRLLVRQVREPLEEAVISETLEQLTGMSDDPVSGAVRAQYEESPYPRWITIKLEQSRPLPEVVGSLFPAARINPVEIDGKTSILDAGCGTGMKAIGNASLYQDSELTAIDLSRSSLSYAARKAKEYNIPNIRFFQADILRLGTWEDRFHFIESAGVLHHMSDTFGALGILANLLHKNGFMRIGLYSRSARQYLDEARDIIRKNNYQADGDGIRKARQALLEDTTTDYPGGMRWKLARSPDFYSMSNCRDLLFHAHENLLTLPEIAKMLDSLQLRFLGFEVKNPQALQVFRQLYPEDSAMQDLGKWNEFESVYPDTFTGMYIFWCQKQEMTSH